MPFGRAAIHQSPPAGGEAEVRQKALSALDDGQPLLHLVNMLDDPALEDGAVCGGTMKILIQPL